jgi:hypothetical protein
MDGSRRRWPTWPGEADLTFETEIAARSSGELLLYVNDAVLHPALTTLFYCNNDGTAHVTVEHVVPSMTGSVLLSHSYAAIRYPE